MAKLLLDELADMGVNAIELMPVGQFPGERNRGYDGVYPYAVQNSYGGTDGLKALVDACHNKGIAVLLDVVYNHLGPEGNYLSLYGTYYTDTCCTPLGRAINFDGEWSDGVKEYFACNAAFWFEQYHVDGLRLDAIHAIFDSNAGTIGDVIYEKVRALEARLGRQLYLIAESDSNSPKVVKHPEIGGLGLDAMWLDDFHHALYVLLDEKGWGRYIDFGRMLQLAKAYTDGFVHSGEYVKFRKRTHGASSKGIPGDKFIVFNMNHDQVGNRVKGERLSVLADHERLKLAAAALILSPYIPLLFMGEEYGDESPFYYFVSHSDKELIKAVREGGRKDFSAFLADGEAFPDPQAEATFLRSKLQWSKRKMGKYSVLLEWYKELIGLRKSTEVLQNLDKTGDKYTGNR
jgi:maltooligosyltrehalose trehalohydrolase